MYSTIIVQPKIDYTTHLVESVNNYKAYTNFPFLLCEASLVAQLLQEGLSWKQIKGQVVDAPPEMLPVGALVLSGAVGGSGAFADSIASADSEVASPFLRSFALMENRDILQIRSKASRQGAIRTLEQLLNDIPQPYLQFLATGNSDLRRATLLFLTLRINRLLREVISEVLLDRLKSLDRSLDSNTIAAFFDLKCEQENVISQWSKSTYQKVCSNTILILVRAGLLIPGNNRQTYEIQAMPIPIQLKQQLKNDGLELYLKLMLN